MVVKIGPGLERKTILYRKQHEKERVLMTSEQITYRPEAVRGVAQGIIVRGDFCAYPSPQHRQSSTPFCAPRTWVLP